MIINNNDELIECNLSFIVLLILSFIFFTYKYCSIFIREIESEEYFTTEPVHHKRTWVDNKKIYRYDV